MTTIKDVAQRAGVSVATVSRVLSGYPYVSAEARELVLQAAEALGYAPDQVARSMRLRRSNMIGLVISTIENVFFTEVARAAEQAAHAQGYHLVVCNTDEQIEREENYLTLLSRQLVAGVILAPAPGPAAGRALLQASPFPLVLTNRRIEGLPYPAITADDEQASFECTSWLIAQGRRRIAAITGLPGATTTEARRHGFRRAFTAAGLPLDPADEVAGRATIEGGYQATVALLQRTQRPDALLAFNNVMTQGAVMAVQDAGLRWPDDIDIAGFGFFQTARLYRPPLTLIDQPTHEMGTRAVASLIAQIEGRNNGLSGDLVLHNRLVAAQR
ncbi:MAG TPA: LacI family DNA-binding transcriptional regulator [Roseiflexaceae bacterium]|nr:LacI family DNA-binding transcriptional regulator [Roseiflexaceae bacterium]